MTKLGETSARKYAKGFKKACIGAKFRQPIAVGAGGFRDRRRFGYYPKEILADQIYCNRKNRKELKEKGIRLLAKPLGRPPAVKKEHLSPGERNPVEGKFGQAKTAYGLANIKARLKDTSESWIACIFLVLNLVKLAGVAPLCLLLKTINWVFSALHHKVSELKLWLSELLWAPVGGKNWNFLSFSADPS